MPYQIEVLTINSELLKGVQSACESLNKVQDEFEFYVPKDNLRSKLYAFHRSEYKADEVFQWIAKYREEAKGSRPRIILIVDGPLSSNQGGNLFGTINKERTTAIFTVNDFSQFVNDRVRFCRYYLTRYAVNFVAPELKSHELSTDKDCIFHFKRHKKEIALSLDSGRICDQCRNILQPHLTQDIDDAIKRLLLVVSNQHPYSIVLKGGGVKGLAFVGALLELEKHFSFDAFAGASAGAIAAILLGAGFNPKELKEELANKDFKDFKDASFVKGLYNLISKKGFYPGDEIEGWINNLIRKKIQKVNEVRMCDLRSQTVVYGSRVKDGTLVFDSYGERRETHAAFAVRCSMSIPYYFIPREIDGIRVYDGGLRNNFPLKRFIQDNQKKPYIGLYLKSYAKKNRFAIMELMDTAIDGEEMDMVDANPDKIVTIETDPVGTTDFKLNKKKKKFLILSGRVSALRFIQAHFPSIEIDIVRFKKLEAKLLKIRANLK